MNIPSLGLRFAMHARLWQAAHLQMKYKPVRQVNEWYWTNTSSTKATYHQLDLSLIQTLVGISKSVWSVEQWIPPTLPASCWMALKSVTANGAWRFFQDAYIITSEETSIFMVVNIRTQQRLYFGPLAGLWIISKTQPMTIFTTLYHFWLL